MDEVTESGGEAAETTTPEEGQGTTEQQPDMYARIDERMTEMQRQHREEMEKALQPLYDRFQEPDEEEDPYPLDAEDDGWDEQEARRLIDQIADQRVQERLAPFERQQNLEKRDNAFVELESQYPEIAQDEGLAQKILGAATDLLQRAGRPELIETPIVAELAALAYKAHVADERASRETPAEQPSVHLEQGGGAAPIEAEEDVQDRLIKQWGQESKSIF